MIVFTTGKLAQKVGVNIETIRYYERKGLLPVPPKRESGYRQYSTEDVTRIKFIKHAQELGFSLKEISELLSLRVDPTCSCGDVKSRAEAKILDVEEKMQILLKIKQALQKLIISCSGRGPTSECPILDAIESDND
ncbi:MerR family transcriptional regulator [Caldithrix abyssi]|nr:MerR family transcriptional regulator [Caldithrix abyssi]